MGRDFRQVPRCMGCARLVPRRRDRSRRGLGPRWARVERRAAAGSRAPRALHRWLALGPREWLRVRPACLQPAPVVPELQGLRERDVHRRIRHRRDDHVRSSVPANQPLPRRPGVPRQAGRRADAGPSFISFVCFPFSPIVAHSYFFLLLPHLRRRRSMAFSTRLARRARRWLGPPPARRRRRAR